jgi:peptidoglycan hydrolase CwlO-like protein
MTFFVLAFFIFAGKLLLSQLSVLKNDWKDYQYEQRFEKNRTKELQTIAVDIAVINVKLNDWHEELQQLGEKIAPFAIEIARTEARGDMLVKIFESEFYLSRNYKSQLSDKQINKLKLG